MLGAALIALLLTITVAAGVLGSAVVARHRVQAGADLAALAAAAAVPLGQDAACARAAAVVRTMSEALADCVIEHLDAVVVVETAVRVGRWNVAVARASARAGPDRWTADKISYR